MIPDSSKHYYEDLQNQQIDKLNPFLSFRAGQKEVIKDILNGFNSGKRFVILQAGTGTGKSIIAYVVAKMMGSSYFITSSKMLQDQYKRDFHDLKVVKGRSNFNCMQNYKTCDDGWCMNNKDNYPLSEFCIKETQNLCTMCKLDCVNISKSKEVCEHKPLMIYEDFELINHFTPNGDEYCEYWCQKIKAIESNTTIMNNWYFLPELNFIGQFGYRDLLVVDEAHNASEILVDNVGLTFELDKLEQITGNRELINDFTGVRNTVMRWYQKFYDLSEFLVDFHVKNENNLGEKEVKLLKENISKCYKIMNWLKEDKSLKEWIIQLLGYRLKVTPLNASRFADQYLFSHTDKVLLMSATLNYEMTLKELGINHDEAIFIDMPTTFPVENCKIYTDYVGKHTGKPENYLNSNFTDMIKLILAKHRNDKGIIHCVSYRVMDFIVDSFFKHDSRLIHHNELVPGRHGKMFRVNNKLERLEQFIHSKNSVFVSPSSYEGLDLADDDVKFQIHCKVPYLSLGDDRIAKKSKQDSKWYAYRASLILEQAIGRGVRSETDSCTNYILDSSFDGLMKLGVVSNQIKERIV